MKLELGLLYIIGIFWINLLFTYIPDTETVKALNSLFLSVGASFIGSTAIIFSIIIFTLQINNERLPHGIFIKLSKDKKLFFSFVIAIIFSIIIASLSLVSDKFMVYYAIQIAFTIVLLILYSFIYSYGRALKLISPIYQLDAIVEDVKKDLHSSTKAIKKAGNNNKDIAKYEYFKNHPDWINSAIQGIIYCNAYSKILIEQNDYETSEKALKSIIDINIIYIEVKGKTFMRKEPFSDTMASKDKLIEDTLEEIRQNIQNALSTNDERFIISNFVILKELHYIYSNINYINNNGDKSASQYLTDGVEASISHNVPNVLLRGIGLLSDVAQKEILDCESRTIGPIIKIISKLACHSMIDKELVRITKCSLEALSKITIQLLLSKEQGLCYINEEMNEHLFLIGKTEITSLHPSYPYFENIYYTKVSTELTNFVYSLTNQELTDDKKINTIKIIKKIEKWSDSIYHVNRELFELALKHNSNLASQLVSFISNISKCLMKLSIHKIVENELSSNLQGNALSLISIYEWMEEEKKVIDLLERCYFTDTLFDLAIFAYDQNLIDITLKVRDILLLCGFRGQKVNKQNRILAKALGGSIYINILLEKNCDDLIAMIKKELDKHALTDDIKSIATNDLLKMSIIHSFSHSVIEKKLNSLNDRKELKYYLDSISKLILN